MREYMVKAKEIKHAYAAMNEKQWTVAEYGQAFAGDVGDLLKLIMAKNAFRTIDDLDTKLAHELSDCLWAALVIADELGIDIEQAFIKNMEELKTRIQQVSNNNVNA